MRSSRLHRFRDHLRRWGLWNFIYWVLYRIVRRCCGVHLFRINVRTIPAVNTPYRMTDGLICRQLSIEELKHLANEPELQLSNEFIDRAYSRGDICIGALLEDRVIAYVWRSFDVTPLLRGIAIWVQSPYCYSYKAFTRTEHRGKGIWPSLGSASDQLCLQRGRNVMIGYIEIDNFSSQRAARKMGATMVGTAGYIECFSRRFVFHDRAVRRTGFRFVVDSRV